MITFQLEHRYNKQEIFTMYANEIPLGQRIFGIYGFGEAAQAYFGKDVRQLDLAECALLAGMIQHPSFLNPYRHPQRAINRRNVVLDAMVDTAISRRPRPKPRGRAVAPGAGHHRRRPRPLLHRHRARSDRPHRRINTSQGLRVYSSLDPDLQEVANEAVSDGMKTVDELVAQRRARAKDPTSIPDPQVALVALNPHTGQILRWSEAVTMVSPSSITRSKRPTGSIFKPFVYAAAFNTSLAGTQLTAPASSPPSLP